MVFSGISWRATFFDRLLGTFVSKLVFAFPYFSILQLSEFVQVESLVRQTARQGFRMMLSMEHESDLRTIIVRVQLSATP